MVRNLAVTTLTFVLGLLLPSPTASIPPVQGTTFAGEQVALPGSLHGRAALLIVGFTEASRQQASDWGHKLAADPQRPPQLAYYEMPVLESVPRLLRGFVLKRIKESVSAKGQAHFLPVLDHEADWKQAAGFSSPDNAYLLLIDDTGTIRWRTQGPYQDQTYAEIKSQTSHLLP
jgi:hypothetical protein